MDYQQLFDRWVALTVLPEKDREVLVGKLHEEVRNGVEVLGALAAAEVNTILGEVSYDQRDAYIAVCAPVLALAALDGYLLSLMEQGINPETAGLAQRKTIKGLADHWSRGFAKDQNVSYVNKTDPIIGLLLNKLYELRVNQILALHPAIVELPYKVTEKLHQYIGWAVNQGYIFGMMEREISQ
ncbi:MAG TPA: hypothetical protein VJB96_05035 [Patescibacteria group bacterium]|nr:hypothetical protein [Patescibacteria group bacterium]